MTDDRADVIERAARAMAYSEGTVNAPKGGRLWRYAEALSDAGLLVSPADQDNTAEVLYTKDQIEALHRTIDLLRAQVAAVRAPSKALLERLDECGHGKYSIHPDDGACVICDQMADLRAALTAGGGDDE